MEQAVAIRALSLSGGDQLPSAIKVAPTNAMIRSTGVRSNFSERHLAQGTVIGGDDGIPINVMRPPKREPKDRGLSNPAGDRPCCRAFWMTTGSKSANAPTLFMKAERMPIRIATALVWKLGPRLKASRPWES